MQGSVIAFSWVMVFLICLPINIAAEEPTQREGFCNYQGLSWVWKDENGNLYATDTPYSTNIAEKQACKMSELFQGPENPIRLQTSDHDVNYEGYSQGLSYQSATRIINTVSGSNIENQKRLRPVNHLTGPQQNAVRSAKQYIRMQGFSRDGLIQQLSSDYGEGYKVFDATVAVDSLNIDWNQEAVRSAKQYISMQGFSCKGLIEQLSSSYGDKYTVSQATYGARQAGACQ